MTKTNAVIAAMQNTFGTAFSPAVSSLSNAMLKVVSMCAHSYDELARGEEYGRPIDPAKLEGYCRSWWKDAGKYDGQTKRVALHYEASILLGRGWTEVAVDGHFAMRSPNGQFIVRYIAVGKTQARSYFERSTIELDDYIREAFRRTYNAVAADAWGEKTPSIEEFRSVVLDLVETHGAERGERRIKQEALDAIRSMPEKKLHSLIGKP